MVTVEMSSPASVEASIDIASPSQIPASPYGEVTHDFYVQKMQMGGEPYFMLVPSESRVEQEITGQFFESLTIQNMMAHIRPGDTVWDVGASTGTHTVPAALKAGKGGTVYAFEPDDEQANLLYRNAQMNYHARIDTFANVHIIPQTPLWNENVPLTLHTSGLDGKAPRVTNVGKSANTPYATFDREVNMNARTISSLVEVDGLTPPDVLKVDVEGVGKKVLEGMGDIRPRHIYLEIHPLYSDTEADSVQFLMERGYSIGFNEQRGNQILMRFDRDS